MKTKTLSIALTVLLLLVVLIVPTYAFVKPKPSYIIITTNEIVYNSHQLQNFISMKFHQGFRVKVVTEDDFDHLVGQAPNGRAEKIRQWLINNYEELNIKYVLLIGDPDPDDPTSPTDKVGDIPMKMCWKNYSKCYEREDPTDFFYADLNSDWNADGDEFFCERHSWDTPESPLPDIIDKDQFWVKWEGKLKCDSSGEYRISTFSDGGVLVMIDDEIAICDECFSTPPVEHQPELKDATINLEKGYHDIQIWYTERYGDALMQLLWTTPETEPEQRPVIPKGNLWHQINSLWAAGGLKGYYYNGYGTTVPQLVRTDETINFVWATGDIKGGSFLDPDPEVYVGRIPAYINDPDKFVVLDSILEKIIGYETDTSDISWRTSMLLPFKLVPQYAVKIADEIAVPNYYTHTTIYDHFVTGPPLDTLPIPDIWGCFPENVVNEWKMGYGMVIWAGHGWRTGASGVIDISYLQQLDDTKPSFTIHGSCNTGWPEDPDNLAYSLLKKNDGSCQCGGGIANIAGGRPTRLSIEQLQYPFTIPNIVTHGMPAGMALCEAKAESSPETFNHPGYVDPNDIQFNLYGDPNIHLQKTFPMQHIENPICGDVNCDGRVDVFDYWHIHPSSAIQICNKWAADVNCDGAVTSADTETIELYLKSEEEVPLQCCFDMSIFAKDKLFYARSYIVDLPADMFKKNAVQMKDALSNKFYAVHELVDTGNYEDAYMKMEKDIRSKMDGLKKDDWITDIDEQQKICGMLDDIKADLLLLIDESK